MTGEPAGYPVTFEVQRAESQSRITNLPLFIGTFIRAILLIPHFIVIYFLQIAASIVYFIATFVILFTGKYPSGMFRFIVNVMRWNQNMNTYLYSLHDRYPPFSFTATEGYPVTFAVVYPTQSSRVLNFPLFIGMLIRVILLIPHLIILWVLSLIAMIVVFIAQFAILFGGSFPAGMHSFVVGIARWGVRVSAYMFGLTDKYPPFSRGASEPAVPPPTPEPTTPAMTPMTPSADASTTEPPNTPPSMEDTGQATT
jgi:hypothetical protein